jgi:hypothetical protein
LLFEGELSGVGEVDFTFDLSTVPVNLTLTIGLEYVKP